MMYLIHITPYLNMYETYMLMKHVFYHKELDQEHLNLCSEVDIKYDNYWSGIRLHLEFNNHAVVLTEPELTILRPAQIYTALKCFGKWRGKSISDVLKEIDDKLKYTIKKSKFEGYNILSIEYATMFFEKLLSKLPEEDQLEYYCHN